MTRTRTDVKRCYMCKGTHPYDGEPIPDVAAVAVDGATYQLRRDAHYRNHHEFQHPDGSTARVILFGCHTMEALTCGLRFELAGPHPFEIDTPAKAWSQVDGCGIHPKATHPAAVTRYARVLAAYRHAYGADTDTAAMSARQRDESMRCTYATPADKWGTDHRARRYLAAYAAVLAELDPAETVWPVERVARAYADDGARLTVPVSCDDRWHGCGAVVRVPGWPVAHGRVYGVGACGCGRPLSTLVAATGAEPVTGGGAR